LSFTNKENTYSSKTARGLTSQWYTAAISTAERPPWTT